MKNFDIFKFICPHCGSEQFVAYSFLYHQMEDKLMIYCCQDEEEIAKVRELYAGDFTTAVDEKGRERAIDTSGYRRRIVIGADNLVEKIRIFDAGLDDRLMEIYKIMLYGQMQPQLAEMPGGDDVDAVFVDEQLDGSLDLVFVANGQAVGVVPFSQEVYDIIENNTATPSASSPTQNPSSTRTGPSIFSPKLRSRMRERPASCKISARWLKLNMMSKICARFAYDEWRKPDVSSDQAF